MGTAVLKRDACLGCFCLHGLCSKHVALCEARLILKAVCVCVRSSSASMLSSLVCHCHQLYSGSCVVALSSACESS